MMKPAASELGGRGLKRVEKITADIYYASNRTHVCMESDQIRMESIRIAFFLPYFNSDTNPNSNVVGYDAKWMSRIRIRIRIFT